MADKDKKKAPHNDQKLRRRARRDINIAHQGEFRQFNEDLRDAKDDFGDNREWINRVYNRFGNTTEGIPGDYNQAVKDILARSGASLGGVQLPGMATGQGEAANYLKSLVGGGMANATQSQLGFANTTAANQLGAAKGNRDAQERLVMDYERMVKDIMQERRTTRQGLHREILARLDDLRDQRHENRMENRNQAQDDKLTNALIDEIGSSKKGGNNGGNNNGGNNGGNNNGGGNVEDIATLRARLKFFLERMDKLKGQDNPYGGSGGADAMAYNSWEEQHGKKVNKTRRKVRKTRKRLNKAKS